MSEFVAYVRENPGKCLFVFLILAGFSSMLFWAWDNGALGF